MKYLRSLAAPLCTLALACGPQAADSDTSEGSGASTSDASTSDASTSDATSTTSTGPSTTGSTTEPTTTTTDPTTVTTTGPTTGAPVCTAPPVTDEQLGQLAFGIFGNDFATMPGTTLTLAIGRLECCTSLEPIDVCVDYRISGEGATYDAATGLLSVAADVPADTVFTLTADIESGRATIVATITVFTKESNPLVGTYHELTQLPCGGGAEVVPTPVMGELWFKANGEFAATWEPFETYFDYWGTYVHDVDTGTLSLTVDGGNYVPPDVDGEGTFQFQNDQLVLTDIWLGSAQDFMGTPACGHRFE